MSALTPGNRRLWLVRSAKLLGLIGILFALYPFFAALWPQAAIEATRLNHWHREIDLTNLPPGELRIIEDWPGGPVALYRRSAHEIAGLTQVTQDLLDATVDVTDPTLPDIFVFNPVSGPRGCQVRVLPASKQPHPDIVWYGGFIDPCSGALYDTAGRIYAEYRGDRQSNLQTRAYRLSAPQRIELLPPNAR